MTTENINKTNTTVNIKTLMNLLDKSAIITSLDSNNLTNEQILGAAQLKTELQRIEAGIPSGMTHSDITDWSTAIASAISGLEEVANKKTSWSNPTSNSNYPSEKLVKDSLDNKVDKVSGKGLSTNDYSNADKEKVDNITYFDNRLYFKGIGFDTSGNFATYDTSEYAPDNTPDYDDDQFGYWDSEIVNKAFLYNALLYNTISYGSIENAPSNLSDFNDDVGYLTEHQDISGKEDTSNKTANWNNTTNNTRYPTEKLVKDSLDNKVDKVNGKGLSSNDYSNDDKAKVDSIEAKSLIYDYNTHGIATGSNGDSMHWLYEDSGIAYLVEDTGLKTDLSTGSVYYGSVVAGDEIATKGDLSNFLTDSDISNFVTTDDSRLSDARTPTSHTHGQITNDGKVTSSAVSVASDDNIVIIDASDSNKIKKTANLLTDQIKDGTAHTNIGSSANATQSSINSSIDTALSNKANSSTVSAIDTRVTALESNEFGIVIKSSFSQLPQTGKAHTLYYVANSGSSPNAYDEYTWTGSSYELMGTTAIDLTDYARIDDLEDYIGMTISSNGDMSLTFTNPNSS